MTRQTVFQRPMFKHRMFQHSLFRHPMFDISFKAPASRTEYWTVYLGLFLLGLASTVAYFLISGFLIGVLHSATLFYILVVPLFVIECAFVFLCTLAVTARRCIDIGISPLFSILICLPYVNFISFIVIGLLETGSVNSGGSGLLATSTVNNQPAPAVSVFDGERELTNDAYKIFLTKSYQIEKNDVLGKFVCKERLFDTVDECLQYAMYLDKTKEMKERDIAKAKADLERAQSGQAVKDCPQCKRWNQNDAVICQWCNHSLS